MFRSVEIVSVVAVRRAAPGDRGALRDLAAALAVSFELDAPSFDVAFDLLRERDGTALFVAGRDGVVAGYVLAFDHPTFFANGPVTWVEELFVTEAERGNGIGRALMEAVERWSRERDAALVALATRRAGSFYEALGYERSADYFRKMTRRGVGGSVRDGRDRDGETEDLNG
jgi:GNAT superfamily N-acetyltransferase